MLCTVIYRPLLALFQVWRYAKEITGLTNDCME